MAAAKTVEQGALGGERISGERERALRLLEELTPRLVKSRQVRGKKLLPTSDADVSYGHEFTNIGGAGRSRFGKATSPGWTPS